MHQNNCVDLETNEMLQNEPLVAKFRFDPAENELSKFEMLTMENFDELVMNEVKTVSADIGLTRGRTGVKTTARRK